MSDHWDFYFSRVNDVLASLMVDLGIRREAPQEQRPWLLWVWVYMRSPRTDGLSDSTETDALEEIEDTLTTALSTIVNAIFVGRITTSGRREFFFYAPSATTFESSLRDAMQQFPLYHYDFGNKSDPEWRQYFDVLYPFPRDHQRILNRHVIDNLTKEGDTLQQARDVHHWIYFRTPEMRQAFVQRVEQSGFRVQDNSLTNRAGDYPYGVSIFRHDSVDLNSIDRVVLDLFELANEMDGEYDGWETCIIKSQP